MPTSIHTSSQSTAIRPGSCPHHGNGLHPGIQHVAGHTQIRLRELVLLGPAQWSVAHALLHHGLEPGQQEVQARSLVGGLQQSKEKSLDAGHRELHRSAVIPSTVAWFASPSQKTITQITLDLDFQLLSRAGIL